MKLIASISLVVWSWTVGSTAVHAAASTNGDSAKSQDHLVVSPRGESSSSSSSSYLFDDASTPQSFIPSVKSVLKIHVPAHNLTQNQPHGEGHTLAQFGLQDNKFRGSMTRFVYYTEYNLCYPPSGTSSGKDHSNSSNTTTKKHTYPPIDQQHGFVHPFFLLAHDDSDDCTYVRMARTAQELGASALILGEKACRCQDDYCKNNFDGSNCTDTDPPMVDDGSASDVTIPTVSLHKPAAEALYKVMREQNQTVMMEFTWGLPLSDDDLPSGNANDTDSSSDLAKYFEPHYYLWSSAHDPLLNARTYEQLRTLAVAFGPTVHFSPRFALQDGTVFHCLGGDDENQESPCYDLCTNHGRYCTGNARGVPGKAIVKETLRRICIHQEYPFHDKTTKKKHDGMLEKKKKNKGKQNEPAINTAYYDYVIYHLQRCTDPERYGADDCIDEAYKAANIEKSKIDDCMKDSGKLDGDNGNNLLDEMLKKQQTSGVVEIPVMTINNQYRTPRPSAYSLFSELCIHYWESAMHSPYLHEDKIQIVPPAVCETCGTCSNTIGCLKAGHCVPWSYNHENDENHTPASGDSINGGKKKRRGHGWTITFFLLAAAVAGGAYFYYWKREQLFGSGNGNGGLLDGYMQLSGGSS